MKKRPLLNLDVVTIENGAFGSPSTKVTNLTFFFLLYILKYSRLAFLFYSHNASTCFCFFQVSIMASNFLGILDQTLFLIHWVFILLYMIREYPVSANFFFFLLNFNFIKHYELVIIIYAWILQQKIPCSVVYIFFTINVNEYIGRYELNNLNIKIEEIWIF